MHLTSHGTGSLGHLVRMYRLQSCRAVVCQTRSYLRRFQQQQEEKEKELFMLQPANKSDQFMLAQGAVEG